MNEKTRIITFIFCSLLSFLIGCAVSYNAGRPNTGTSTSAREYRERAEECERRLAEISERCENIDRALGTAESSIHGVVERLYVIADQVAIIEDIARNNGRSSDRNISGRDDLRLIESVRSLDAEEE